MGIVDRIKGVFSRAGTGSHQEAKAETNHRATLHYDVVEYDKPPELEVLKGATKVIEAVKEVGPEPHDIYQIWHDQRSAMDRIGEVMDATRSPFPYGYAHVADVRAASPHEALELTQYIEREAMDGSTEVFHFNERPQVSCRVEEPRNNQRMDVIVDPHGNAHRVDREGFKEISRTQLDPLELARRRARQAAPEEGRDRGPER